VDRTKQLSRDERELLLLLTVALDDSGVAMPRFRSVMAGQPDAGVRRAFNDVADAVRLCE
jgi:hypothetical protein